MGNSHAIPWFTIGSSYINIFPNTNQIFAWICFAVFVPHFFDRYHLKLITLYH